MQLVHRCLQLRTDSCAPTQSAMFGIHAHSQVLALDLGPATVVFRLQ